MGYELNRLMQQYGVSTPSMVAPPVVPAPDASEADKAAYAADKKAYDVYSTEYMNRLNTVPMYGQRQYNTFPMPPAPKDPLTGLYQRYLGRDPEATGLEYWNQQMKSGMPLSQVQNFISASPEAQTYVPSQAAMTQNLLNTGSYYNQPLKSPVYTYIPPPPPPPPVATLNTDQYADLQKRIDELESRQASYNQNPYYNYGFGDGDGTAGDDSFGGEVGGGASGGNANADGSVGGGESGTGTDGEAAWALGGAVKKYAPGGEVEVEDTVTPVAPLTAVGEQNVEPVPVPEAPPIAAAPTPEIDRAIVLQGMLDKYGPQSGGYTSEVAAARQRHRAETEAFNKLLESQLNSPESEQQSKAEMYFRLAAAFGSPTKTGMFTEHLGLAGRELAEHAKGKRESAAGKRDLMLQAQQLKMAGTKEDLATVRALEAESMKDRRAIAQEMIKEYIASGKPQSEAGRRAKDMGFKPGTPEYQKKVQEFADIDLQNKMNQINAQIAALGTAQENLRLRQEISGRLSPGEIKLRVEAEDFIANGQQALQDLEKAYSLNPNTFAGGWLEQGQRALLEAGGSNDPKVVNTRIVENLLGSQGLAKLRAAFGGNPTEGERAILLELEGIGAKTREERAQIIKRTYKVLQDRVAREQRRLDDIISGAYRTTKPLGGED